VKRFTLARKIFVCSTLPAARSQSRSRPTTKIGACKIFSLFSPERVMTRSLPRIHPDSAQLLNGSAWLPSVAGWDALGGVFNHAPKIG